MCGGNCMRVMGWIGLPVPVAGAVGVDEAREITDRLSGHDDRWLFLFALVLLTVVVLAVARYFVGQYERLQGEHQEILASLMGRQEERQTELVRVVAANTEALREVTRELRWCKERNLAAGAGAVQVGRDRPGEEGV